MRQLRARLRDAMQSRGDAAHRQADQINAQRSNNASYAELYTLYLTGLRWGVSAHLIVYQQLSSTNHWHQHQHHELVKEPNIDQWVSAFEQLEVWLPAAQGLINAVFELCDAIENTTEKEQALNTMHPVLSTLLDLACGGGGSSGNSNGSGGSGSSEWSGGSGNSDGSGDRKRSKACAPVLYYQVKYLQFRADYFQHFAQRAEEMHALNKALTVWAQLDALGHYGSGNKLSDPHKEVSVLLTRMARLLCLTSATYDSDSLAVNKAEENAKLKQGLEYVLRSLNYTAHAWLSPTQHQTLLSSTAPSSTAASSWSTEKRAGIESIFAVNALLQVPSKVLLRLVEGCHCAQQCLSSSTTAMESAALGITGLPVRDNNTNHKQKKVFAWLLLRFCDALSAQGRPCDPALRLHQQQQAGEQATLSPRVKKTLKRLKRKT